MGGQVWEEAGRRDEQSAVVLPCLLHALTLRREDVTKKKKGEVRGRGISAPAPLRPLELDPHLCANPGWAGPGQAGGTGSPREWRGLPGLPRPLPPLCADAAGSSPSRRVWGTAQQGRE